MNAKDLTRFLKKCKSLAISSERERVQPFNVQIDKTENT